MFSMDIIFILKELCPYENSNVSMDRIFIPKELSPYKNKILASPLSYALSATYLTQWCSPSLWEPWTWRVRLPAPGAGTPWTLASWPASAPRPLQQWHGCVVHPADPGTQPRWSSSPTHTWSPYQTCPHDGHLQGNRHQYYSYKLT